MTGCIHRRGGRIIDTVQLDLFAQIAGLYANAANGMDNATLYKQIADKTGVDRATLERKIPIGVAQTPRSPVKRRIRWIQQSLKAMGILEHVPDARGVWRLTESAGRKLHKAAPAVKMLAFSTNLGIGIWGSCESVFRGLGEPISLIISSPPYPLRVPRNYGNPNEQEIVDFICRSLADLIKNLEPGGSIVLNVGNDIFLDRSPARSLYQERLVLALCDRFGLYKMDQIIWMNPSRPPGPIQYASKQRVQLNATWESVLWFTNDPTKVRSNNRRVLEPHTERHLKLIANGGENRVSNSGDGAHKVRPGNFGNQTSGKIPRNVLIRPHNCPDSNAIRKFARQLDLPPHGAMQPTSIADFMIRFLTNEDDLVAEPFAGSFKAPLAAQRLKRRWIASEIVLGYTRVAAEAFRAFDGFKLNPGLEAVRGPLAAQYG